MLDAPDQHTSDEHLGQTARTSLKNQLLQRGLVEAPASEATWLCVPSLRVLKKIHRNDAYFASDTIIEYEEAELKVELLRGSTSERAWSGSTRWRLRDLCRGSGLYQVRKVDLNRDREWSLAQMVSDIVGAIP